MTEAVINQPFVASNGWWDRYSKRMNLASENLLGEAASADIKAAEEFPEKLKKIIEIMWQNVLCTFHCQSSIKDLFMNSKKYLAS